MSVTARSRYGTSRFRDNLYVSSSRQSRGPGKPGRPTVTIHMGPVHIDLRADAALRLANELVDSWEDVH